MYYITISLDSQRTKEYKKVQKTTNEDCHFLSTG